MPRIISAAIKFKPRGHEYFQIMCGRRHCDVLEMMYQLHIDYERSSMIQGFLTDEDQFLDRYDAACAAYFSGQLFPDTELWQKMASDDRFQNAHALYSEDLW